MVRKTGADVVIAGTGIVGCLIAERMLNARMSVCSKRGPRIDRGCCEQRGEAAHRTLVELPVADNKYVHKGDLLMVIDPTNYTIAVSQGTAARAYGRLRCDRWRSLGPSESAATGGCRARVKRTRANTAQ